MNFGFEDFEKKLPKKNLQIGKTQYKTCLFGKKFLRPDNTVNKKVVLRRNKVSKFRY